MTEEFIIKVKPDFSPLYSGLEQAKSKIKSVNQSIDASLSTSTAAQKTGAQTAKATNELSKSVNNLFGGLRKLGSLTSAMDIAEMASEFLAAHIQTKAVKQSMETVTKETAKTVSATEKYVAELREAVALAKQAAPTTFTGGKGNQTILQTKPSTKYAEKELAKNESILKAQQYAASAANSVEEFEKSLAAAGTTAAATGTAMTGAASGTAAAGTAAAGASGAFASLWASLAPVLGILAAVTAVLIPFIAGIKSAFSVSALGDAVYHSAQQFGFSSKAYQEWGWIMERNGSTIDDLKGFLETLASEQAAVIEGSEDAAANFKRLGMSMDEVVGMDQQTLFEETVAKIQSIEDATQRSAIAYSIFGDEASRLMNVLNMSNAEMQDMINSYHMLGGSMSGELLEKSNSLQNSIANLKQAWQGISNTLAEVFIPVVQAVVNWLTKAIVIINLFLRSIFGLELNTKGASSGMNKGVSANKAYANSAKAATKAVNELKRTTMGFDELNIVADPNKSAGSNSGAAAATPSMGAGVGNIGDMIPDASDLNLEGIYEWFEKYKGLIRDITAVTMTLIGLAMLIFGFGNIPVMIAGAGMLGIGLAIGYGDGAIFERIDKAIIDFCKKAAKTVADWITSIVKWLVELDKKIGDGLMALLQIIIDGVKWCWDGIVSVISVIVGWINDNIITPISEAFSAGWEAIKTTVKNAWNSMKETASNIWTGIKNIATGAWDGIKNAFKTAGTWFNQTVIQPVANFFTGMWNGLKNGAKGAWDGIKSVFSSITSWFKEKFTQAWTAVKNVFSTGGKIFDGIKEGIASTFKTVVNGLIGGINKIIAAPFNTINGLLNKIRSIDILGVQPFINMIKYNALSVPQIPKLATGGIVTRETLAMMGEGGKKEAVLPLEQNTGWMDALADKIAARNNTPSQIVLKIGEKEFAWAAINGINSVTKQTGGLQLALV